MKLIEMIPLNLIQCSIEALKMEYTQYTFVISQGYLKIYEQMR